MTPGKPVIDRAAVRLVLRRAGWFSAAVAGALLFFCLGLLFRVLVGPVSLGPLNGELHEALKQVVPGLDVRFDDAALEWSRQEQRIDLVILGTRVLDRGGHIVAQAPKAEIGLSVGPFLRGQVVVDRIALIGVQLTLVHTSDGALRLGIEPGHGEDVLQRIRDAISHHKGGPSTLNRFAVQDARLAFYDEETGAFVVAPVANLQVSAPVAKANRKPGALTASLTAQIEISGAPARIFATMNFPGTGDLVNGDISITGLSLPALARDGKSFGFLAPLALKTDVTGSWTLSHGTTLKSADFGIGASGYVNNLGHPFHVRLLRLVGRYDGLSGRVLIDDAALSGEEASIHLTGRADLSFDANTNLRASAFALAIDRIALDIPGAMEHAVSLGQASLKGVYTRSDSRIVFEEAELKEGRLSGAFAGNVTFATNQSPELDLDGKLEPIEIHDLLPYWPLKIAPGARAWIAANVLAGRVGPLLIHTRIPAGAFDRPALPDDSISVSFPVTNASVNYLHGLTPVTKVSATGTLTGDAFKANLASGAVGPLSLSQGHLTIANLHVHGAPADIGVHVTGQLPQVLALLDMKPLQYPTRFHVNTQSARGEAAFDASFKIPTIRNVSIDAIAISAKGTINDLALALGPHTHVSNGTLALNVTNAGLNAAGKATLGAATLDLDWAESFKPTGPVSTQLKLHGILDDAARAQFNLASGDYLTGPVGVDANLDGYRGVIQHASARLDLTQAVMNVDLLSWSKPAGTQASATVNAQLDQSQNVRSAHVVVDGSGLSANGDVIFGPQGTIQNVEMPTVRIGTADDFAIALKELPGNGLDLAISGHALDASGLGRHKPGAHAKAKPAESSEPFHINVKVDRLALRNGVVVAPFSLDTSGMGDQPRALTAFGSLSKAATISATISGGESGRRLALSAGDAGLLIKGFLGPAIVQGGDLELQATMPQAGGHSDYAGELTIRNCTIVNQPFLTRLSSSGSVSGLAGMMRGGGIALDSVHIPFRFQNNVVNIHDARATGPSVGVTADGYIDRDTSQVALQGAIAPLYGINGLLGAIPVIGDVFVSKKGEGLFGITYSIHGDIDSPEISANPLSVLAPGILRRIFEGGVPKAPAAPSASATPPPQQQQQ